MKKVWLLAIAYAVSAAQMASAAVVWGGFDASRINYAGGTLDGTAHVTLRSIIAAHDGQVGPLTPLLTDDYLNGVDVFYTSLLRNPSGELSQPEREALRRFIEGGGTLIVTADIFPLPAYESFTAQFGVTGYRALSGVGVGQPVADHPITQNVAGYGYNTESTYNYGNDAKLLGNNGRGSDFLIVMEPATGFNLGGRIVVLGDHNMFTEGLINQNDNRILAGNIAAWAAAQQATCVYTIAKSKGKQGCNDCPAKGGDFRTQTACSDQQPCKKKIKTTVACNSGPGICKIKGKSPRCE